MIYNNTEQDNAEAITEYKPTPTWKETLDASTKNFTSVSLSTSASNYYQEERDKTVKEWIDKDPNNEGVYRAIGTSTKQNLDKLEALYELGRYDAIRTFNGVQTRRQNIKEGQATVGTAFLKFKELQKQNGFTDPNEIRQRAEEKSYNDFTETSKVLEDSEYTSAKLLGTAWGALQDPVTLATLPLGTWKTGATVIGTAGKAFMEEALIEVAAQAVILPQTYAYKNEIGIDTTIKDEAYNAVAAITSAGLLRGVGSAAFDLTAKGMKNLKIKDPELAEQYEQLSKNNLSEDMDSHINDLHKNEFSEEPVTKIKNPNEQGKILNEAENIPFEDDKIIQVAREAETTTKTEDLKIFSGEDESGASVYKSRKELQDELDIEDAWIKKAKDCVL